MSDEEDNEATSLNCLDSSAEDIRGEGLEILQDEHLEGATKDLMRLIVVCIADLSGGDEQVKGVINILVVKSLHLLILGLFHSLLLVAGELEFLIVTPQHIGAVVHRLPGQDVVEVDNLIASTIAYQKQNCAVMLFDVVLNQGLHPAIYLLLHC